MPTDGFQPELPFPDRCQRWQPGRRQVWVPASRGGFDRSMYEVEPISEQAARTFVLDFHYSGTYPVARRRFGLVYREPCRGRSLPCCGHFASGLLERLVGDPALVVLEGIPPRLRAANLLHRPVQPLAAVPVQGLVVAVGHGRMAGGIRLRPLDLNGQQLARESVGLAPVLVVLVPALVHPWRLSPPPTAAINAPAPAARACGGGRGRAGTCQLSPACTGAGAAVRASRRRRAAGVGWVAIPRTKDKASSVRRYHPMRR